MYCGNCGYEIKDGHKFCLRCGTPVPTEKKEQSSTGATESTTDNQQGTYNSGYTQNTSNGTNSQSSFNGGYYQNSNNGNNQYNNNNPYNNANPGYYQQGYNAAAVNTKKSSKKPLVIAIIVIVLLLMGGIGFLAENYLSSSPAKVVETMINATLDADTKKMDECFLVSLEDAIGLMAKESGKDIEEFYEQIGVDSIDGVYEKIDEMLKGKYDDMKDDGESVKLKKVTEGADIEDDDFDKLIDDIEDDYGDIIDVEKISEAKIVKAVMEKTDSDGEKEKESQKFKVVCYKGKWYISGSIYEVIQ